MRQVNCRSPPFLQREAECLFHNSNTGENTMTKHPFTEMKEIQNARVAKIRELKQKVKEKDCFWRDIQDLGIVRRDYRHFHIAYCELRGRTREQIEQKCREKPHEGTIDKLKRKWELQVVLYNEERERRIIDGKENVRSSAA